MSVLTLVKVTFTFQNGVNAQVFFSLLNNKRLLGVLLLWPWKLFDAEEPSIYRLYYTLCKRIECIKNHVRINNLMDVLDSIRSCKHFIYTQI